MDEQSKRKMINILTKLLQHPTSRIFGSKILPGEDFPPEYFEIVKKPIDISTVIENIEANNYRSLKECVDDVELVWNNAEKFYGKKSQIWLLANEVKNIFKKLYRPLYVRTIHGYCDESYRLRTKIEKLILTSPYISSNGEIPNLTDDKRGLIKQLAPEEEMQSLITACEMLTDKEDHQEIKAIIEARQPELIHPGKKTVIMTTQLNPATFREIKNYVKNALKKQGLEYPS
ncbi:Bromodomain containing protein [Tritrichomonas foetus]|uniref:Bromodomain containing protein n=1 Tax=Tritrichomonas foetus TaxID=1144522 RepID=A0A1J4KIL0_9EUKA|nr:Bromodomain containing protein [Tritrichomonas foetus]|eukprot:OHT09652.1 Bromodomain containing protein [Tritrichomonas foetus]